MSSYSLCLASPMLLRRGGPFHHRGEGRKMRKIQSDKLIKIPKKNGHLELVAG